MSDKQKHFGLPGNEDVTLFLLLFITHTNAQEQVPEPVYKLATKHFSSSRQLGVVIRYDGIIDSVDWPIDTSLLNFTYKQLNIQGLPATEEVVCYMYYFEAITSCNYVLPEGRIWSKGKSHPLLLTDTLKLI